MVSAALYWTLSKLTLLALCPLQSPTPFNQDGSSARCFPAWSRSCFLVEHHGESVGPDLKYIKEPLCGSFAVGQCRQLKSSTNLCHHQGIWWRCWTVWILVLTPWVHLWLLVTCQAWPDSFKSLFQPVFFSLHPLSFQMILCGMVSKPYRAQYSQHFHLHTFSNFILESRLVSQIQFAISKSILLVPK